MATFSIGEALGAGFSLIRRRPLSVWAWGLAYIIITVLPALAMFASIGPAWLTMMHQLMQQTPGAPAQITPAMLQLNQSVFLIEPLIWLTVLISQAVVQGAVIRSVLEPRNKAFASLRLGSRELWLGLVFLVEYILLAVSTVAIAVVCVIAALTARAALANTQGAPWSGLVTVVSIGVAVCVYLWLLLRFSLAGPMTFALRKFSLFESWKVTKGVASKLLGLGLIMFAIVIGLEMVIGAVVCGILFAVVGVQNLNPAAMTDFVGRLPHMWPQILPWLALVLVLESAVYGALFAIFIAPWASAYLQLTGEPAPPPPSEAGAAALEAA